MSTEAAKQPIRSSMGFRNEILPILHDTYASSLIEWMKTHDYKLTAGNLTFYLAQEFGFCYGVDKAVALAYETSKMFPTKRIFLTSEIIHNPRVNSTLKEKGIHFLSTDEGKHVNFDPIQKDDVVIIPAFGTTTEQLALLEKKGCTLVDTTCGSVVHVWKRVEKYARDGYTAIVHGKYDHEETRATCSRVQGGKYLIVRDIPQTKLVIDFIFGKIKKEDFLPKFSKEAYSEGFDPEKDLVKVGCANQTTMLSGESMEVAELLQQAMKEKYGVDEIPEHFRHFDTICSATQERQDAIMSLVKEGLDLFLVIGGYNSSNTGHLVEMAAQSCPSFHIQDATDIISRDEIRHQPAFKKTAEVTKGWLAHSSAALFAPEAHPSSGVGGLKIGITAGASTPNKVMEEVMKRVLEVSNIQLPVLE